MTHDDGTIGRLLSRRAALAWLGAAGLAWSVQGRAADSTMCIARPEQTEGPFYVDEGLERRDIRSDPATGAVSPGAPLQLAFAVSLLAPSGCAPLAGAKVDVWQCDAAGRYSDVRDFTGSTVGRRFLRGHQTTDAQGIAQFVTIVPGWYEGRAVHIHFKVDAAVAGGPRRVFTSQLYFDEAFVDRVHAQPPYAARGTRRVRNRADGLYRAGGDRLLLTPQTEGEAYAARFVLGLTT
jgi:protocatechuate 3,4-dioxygenase beta subunit